MSEESKGLVLSENEGGAVNFERLRELALRVGQTHEEQKTAQGEETDAEAALLKKVVEAVLPALKALSSRIQKGSRLRWVSSIDMDEKREWFERTAVGFRVLGVGDQRDYPRADRGDIVGDDLFLHANGTFSKITYSGTWTKRQGEGSSWEAKLEGLTYQEVAARYEIQEIILSICAALEQQEKGKAKDRTEAAKKRAAKVRALTELLGK